MYNPLETVNHSFGKFNDLKKIVQDLNKGLKEIEVLRDDPENYIYEYFKELNRQVDIRRDMIIIEVEQYSNELIQKIDVIHKECSAKVTTKTKTTDCVENCKAKLEELNGIFNTFEIDNNKYEEILTQRSKELENLLNPLERDYKSCILGNKCYKIDLSDLKIDQVFGSLQISDDLKVINIFINKIFRWFSAFLKSKLNFFL